jgi:hypothetical protein
MANDLDQLKKAREALIKERIKRTTTILTGGASITETAMDNFVKVQEAIEAVERAIEQLEDEEE